MKELSKYFRYISYTMTIFVLLISCNENTDKHSNENEESYAPTDTTSTKSIDTLTIEEPPTISEVKSDTNFFDSIVFLSGLSFDMGGKKIEEITWLYIDTVIDNRKFLGYQIGQMSDFSFVPIVTVGIDLKDTLVYEFDFLSDSLKLISN